MPAVMEAIDKLTTAEKVEVMNYLWGAVTAAGERFVPVWRIAGYGTNPQPAQKRVSLYGSLKGKVQMSPDFDAPLEDFAEYM